MSRKDIRSETVPPEASEAGPDPDPGSLEAERVGWTALTGAAFTYTCAHAFHFPVPVYLPELTRWTWSPPPDAIGMHYFGILLWGALGFLAGGAWGGLRRGSEFRAATWALVACAVALIYFVWSEWA